MGTLKLKLIFTTYCAFLLSLSLIGQDVPETKLDQNNSAIAIGVSFGTKSVIGVDVAFQTAPNWVFKVGYNYLDWRVRNFESNFGFLTQHLSIDADIRFSSFDLMVEHRIFNKKLGLVAGVGYFPVNHYKGKILLRDSVQFSDTWWTPEELGSVGGSFSYRSPISPFVGISFGHAIPKKQWGFSFNFGTYYKGRPDIEIIGTNLLDNIDREEKDLENAISSYRWMPILSFRIAYKLYKPKPTADPLAIFPEKK